MGRELSGDHCRCMACGERFNSTYAFDKHRVGAYAPIGKLSTRRCLGVAEMTAAGMSRNAGGWWISKAMADPSKLGARASGATA